MKLTAMPYTTALHILNMIAYGCMSAYEGAMCHEAHALLRRRMEPLMPDADWMPEFEGCVTADEVDNACVAVVKRIQAKPPEPPAAKRPVTDIRDKIYFSQF